MPDDQPPMTEDEIRKAIVKREQRAYLHTRDTPLLLRALRDLLTCREALGDCLTALHRLSKISIGIAQKKGRAALGDTDGD